MNCAGCAFFVGSDSINYDGTCHRYPPQRKRDSDGEFQIIYIRTYRDYWCGEWKQKEQAS